jgi:hypothetical protein
MRRPWTPRCPESPERARADDARPASARTQTRQRAVPGATAAQELAPLLDGRLPPMLSAERDLIRALDAARDGEPAAYALFTATHR